MLPYAIELDGQFAGQLTIGNVTHGALRSAWIGYWVASGVTGGGVATAALALGLDHCFGPVMLHRVEATVRPENAASRATVYRIPTMASLDGNTVEMATEQAAFAENAVAYTATLGFLRGRVETVTRAISGE